MESKIKVKATLPEMKAFFERDGGVRYYEIKDSRYTAADINAMPDEKLNNESFTFLVIYRHAELQKKLTGTFSINGLVNKVRSEWDAILMAESPLYRHTASYAREHDELPLYRQSLQANIACKKVLEDAIRENYRDDHLDTDSILNEVRMRFSMERIQYVLANTIQQKDCDGRISRDNKEWAKTVPVVVDKDAWGAVRNSSFVVDQAHTGLVDIFVTQFRKILEKEPVKKPSVRSKLQKAQETTSPKISAKSKEQER